jgi:hypothetical protein
MHAQNQKLHVDQGFCGLILPSFKQTDAYSPSSSIASTKSVQLRAGRVSELQNEPISCLTAPVSKRNDTQHGEATTTVWNSENSKLR